MPRDVVGRFLSNKEGIKQKIGCMRSFEEDRYEISLKAG